MKLLSISASSLVWLGCLIVQAQAIYIYVKQGESKCFTEEMAAGSLLVGQLLVEEFDTASDQYIRNKDVSIAITITENFDAGHEVAHMNSDYNGQFAFTALESGDHEICLTPTGFSDPKGMARLHVDFVQGDRSRLDSKGRDGVVSILDTVRGLNQQLEEIRREQELIREREQSFRNLSEEANAKVWQWSLVQIGLLAFLGAVQLYTLKQVFIKSKVL